jgi:hypothetical protein
MRSKGVRVTDNKTEATEKSTPIKLRITNFLVFAKYKHIAKVITDA